MPALRIVSLAPQADPTRPDAGASHFIGFQQDLRAAALALGHEFVVLVPEGTSATDGRMPVLPRSALQRKVFLDDPDFVAAVDAALRRLAGPVGGPRIVVLRYEGKVQELAAIAGLAARHPTATFVWNLLAAPSDARGIPIPAVPANLRVLSDNDARHTWALERGIPSLGVWPLHSRLAGAGAVGDLGAGGPTRVLVSIAGWQSSPAARARIEYVIRRVRHAQRAGGAGDARDVERADGSQPLRWTIAGHTAPDAPHARWARRMERDDVRSLIAPLPAEAYADLFAAHPVVWFPAADGYAMKSSGKVIDALAAGCVVVAPAGSFHAREASRWQPPDLAHDTPDGAVAVLAGLPCRLAALGAHQGERQRADVRAAYDPVACLERILATATGPAAAPAPSHATATSAWSADDAARADRWRPAAPLTWAVARARAGGRG